MSLYAVSFIDRVSSEKRPNRPNVLDIVIYQIPLQRDILFPTCSHMGIEFKKGQIEPDLPDKQEKLRICLMCGKEFLSVWAGNRICKKCRSRDDFRSS